MDGADGETVAVLCEDRQAVIGRDEHIATFYAGDEGYADDVFRDHVMAVPNTAAVVGVVGPCVGAVGVVARHAAVKIF